MTERSQGHAAGDALLATVAQTMRNSLRAGDIIARSGGDEFLIVLALPTEEAGRVMTRIIGELPIGASYGVAPLRDFRRFDEAVAVADAEMYLDKTHKETHGPKLPA
jgi:diguanylate cyclase (GGDEF)-like protein